VFVSIEYSEDGDGTLHVTHLVLDCHTAQTAVVSIQLILSHEGHQNPDGYRFALCDRRRFEDQWRVMGTARSCVSELIDTFFTSLKS
jgi:hypothetical protein